MIRDRGKHRFHRTQRHRDQHHVGTLDGARKIGLIAVDHAEVDGLLQVFRAASGADDLPDLPGRAQGARQRTADQADTDDAQPLDHDSTFSSAARKRVFSAVLPTVTRR